MANKGKGSKPPKGKSSNPGSSSSGAFYCDKCKTNQITSVTQLVEHREKCGKSSLGHAKKSYTPAKSQLGKSKIAQIHAVHAAKDQGKKGECDDTATLAENIEEPVDTILKFDVAKAEGSDNVRMDAAAHGIVIGEKLQEMNGPQTATDKDLQVDTILKFDIAKAEGFDNVGIDAASATDADSHGITVGEKLQKMKIDDN